jgi:predicted AAA+ superfamily ATPase
MKIIHRLIEKEVLKGVANFPSIMITGPRRAGKTTLLKSLFPKAQYYLLEDPDLIARVRADPKGFLEGVITPVILDEIQNVPEIFGYLRTIIDSKKHQYGRWLLTGSQEAPLMRGVTESMAGRTAIFQLLPFSLKENSKVTVFNGGFPEVLAKPAIREIWFRSYMQTYLERDVRAISTIKDLTTFRRFLSLLASRVGNILNKTDLASPLGVSVPTIGDWLNILEITGQIILVPPFYENFGKRMIKAPKVYFIDPGLACYLLNIDSYAALLKSPFFGSIFEGFVASEIIKTQINAGKRRELYYFRDQQGLEVDFIIPKKDKLLLCEVKATKTIDPRMAFPMESLARNIKKETEKFIIHPHIAGKQTKVVAKGAKSCAINDLEDILL